MDQAKIAPAPLPLGHPLEPVDDTAGDAAWHEEIGDWLGSNLGGID